MSKFRENLHPSLSNLAPYAPLYGPSPLGIFPPGGTISDPPVPETLWRTLGPIKGIGGGSRVKFLDFLSYCICYSPEYLVSKMGSFASQFATTAEI